MTTHGPTAILKPNITLSAGDYERLSVLAHAAMNRAPELATALVEELDRAISQPLVPNGLLLRSQIAVDERARNLPRLQFAHLLAHKSLERRYDEPTSMTQQDRHLKAERFA